jgi:hypothetical protein
MAQRYKGTMVQRKNKEEGVKNKIQGTRYLKTKKRETRTEQQVTSNEIH